MTKSPPPQDELLRPIRLLLLVPFAAVLWPPVYNHAEPMLAGVPFFYWYQMLWIAITALILWFVYAWERRNPQ